MKKIETFLRPFKLDEIKDTLSEIGIENITITDVRSSGGEKKKLDSSYLAEDYIIEFLPRIKLEIIVDDKKAEKVATTIKKALKTSEDSATEIFVFPIEKIY